MNTHLCGRPLRILVFSVAVALASVSLAASRELYAQSTAMTSRVAAAKTLTFAVNTVKPSHSKGWKMYFETDGFTSGGVTLQMLVQEAYAAYSGDYVTGGPAWAAQDRFDVRAKLDPDEIPEFANLALSQRRAMLQILLAERFHVAVHQETHAIHSYALQIAKNGPKLSKPDPAAGRMQGVMGYDCSLGGRGPIMGDIQATNCSMQDLAQVLSGAIAPKIIDHTGVPGRFNFELHWTPEQRISPMQHAQDEAATVNESYPAIFAALKEQLGLQLVPAEVPVQVVVIDHAEPPASN